MGGAGGGAAFFVSKNDVYTYPIAHTTRQNTLQTKRIPTICGHTQPAAVSNSIRWKRAQLHTVTHVHHSARPTAHRLPSTTSIQSFTPSATSPSTNSSPFPNRRRASDRRDSRQGVISNGVRTHETFLHPPPITHVPQRREFPCLHTIAQFTIMAVSNQARRATKARL